MDKITADSQLAGKLPALHDKTAVYDQNGHAIGIYYPMNGPREAPYPHCPYTDDELDAIEGEEGGFTFEEVLSHLHERKNGR